MNRLKLLENQVLK